MRACVVGWWGGKGGACVSVCGWMGACMRSSV